MLFGERGRPRSDPVAEFGVERVDTLGVNGILGARLASSLFRRPEAAIPDDRYLAEWTTLLATRIESLRSSD